MKRLVLIPSLLASFALAACSDDSQQRLTDVLSKQGIKEVTVTEAKVTARCASGATAEVDAAELQKNFLGMVKSERLGVVANDLFKKCDDLDKDKHKAEAQKQLLADAAKELGIDVSAMDDDAAKKAICEKLTAKLPVKDPERAVEDVKNQNRFGCAPAPAPAALPTGLWQVETRPGKRRKPPTTYARLDSEHGERLTASCTGRKADLYVMMPAKVKHHTKVIYAVAGSSKPMKWKVKPSTDGKALFIVDAKGGFRAMKDADSLTLKVPMARKVEDVAFPVKGFDEVLKQLPRHCR